jgi:hypothetical protein
MSDIDDFITLFRGRGDCYGSDEGGCVRKPLERRTFVDHLEGSIGIGVILPSHRPRHSVYGDVAIST